MSERILATVALTLLSTSAFADSPLEPAYLEVLVIDGAEVQETKGEVTIAGTLVDASCGDGQDVAVCGSGQAFVVFLDSDGAAESGYFGEVLSHSVKSGDIDVVIGGLGASRLVLSADPFKADTFTVYEDFATEGLAGTTAHLDDAGDSVWSVEGTTLTPGDLVADIGEDCWLTADDNGVTASIALGGSDARGIWGTGGVAVWGTDGTAIWGTGGVKSDTKTIWGTGGVALDAIWGTGGVAIWGTGGAMIPWPGSSWVYDKLPSLDAAQLAKDGLAVQGDWAAASHMTVEPL